MEGMAHQYDSTSRTGPKVFVGEWASIGGNPTPTFNEALGDAAWLTGLERNSDLVVMEAYAPLLVNVNPGGSQWPTNLIGYDALKSFGSPSYYVQSIFAKYTGDTVLPVATRLARTAPEPMAIPRGGIGVGTWITNAEFKDPVVTSSGKTLYSKDFKSGDSGWAKGQGQWTLEDGALRQTGLSEDTRATAGDPDWSDYTYHVKARKLSGAEGFFIVFHYQNDQNFLRWNVGGWGNSRSAVQRQRDGQLDEVGASTNTTVEAGRWYDVKIELKGIEIKCYLDGKLITTVTDAPRPPVKPLYVSASLSSGSGDVYLKVVNVSSRGLTTDVELDGVTGLGSVATGWVMTGKIEEANTVQEPTKVAPKPVTVNLDGTVIHHEFPAHSITVLKLRKP
jgi:alpha-L-arabinofuranosidase